MTSSYSPLYRNEADACCYEEYEKAKESCEKVDEDYNEKNSSSYEWLVGYFCEMFCKDFSYF